MSKYVKNLSSSPQPLSKAGSCQPASVDVPYPPRIQSNGIIKAPTCKHSAKDTGRGKKTIFCTNDAVFGTRRCEKHQGKKPAKQAHYKKQSLYHEAIKLNDKQRLEKLSGAVEILAKMACVKKKPRPS